jgi:DNA-binding GntR family transcriptional regulator
MVKQVPREADREGPADLRVAPVTVQFQTVTKLRDAIVGGHFRPGERLIEADLCQVMGVSRSSVREALRRLEAERLVTIVPNKGPSVAVIEWAEAEEIYHVRSLLEGEAAALCARRATPAILARMQAALEAFEQSVAADDAMGRLATTTRFYDALLEGCGNGLIRELLQGLIARINVLRAQSMSRPGRARISAIEMRRLFAVVARHDARGARAAAIDHVTAACAAARIVFAPEPGADTARRPAASARTTARTLGAPIGP